MRIGGNAGRLSIVVLALLAAVVALLIILQPEQARETQRKSDRTVARAAAQARTVRETASRPPAVRLRLPPPPAPPAKSTGTAARKTATRATPARRTVTPLRPSKPAPRARPRRSREPPPKRITPLAGKETPAPAKAAADAASVAVAPATRKAGRALLRLLEHGKGPSVEIAWPDDARDRTRLHRLLGRCYGMRLAVMDGADRLLFVADKLDHAV